MYAIVIIVTRVIILIPFKRRTPCVDIVHGELVSILDPPRYVLLCPLEGKTTKKWEIYKL